MKILFFRILTILVLSVACFTVNAQSTVYVTANLNIRQYGAPGSRIVGVIPNGTALTCDDDEVLDNAWVEVSYKGVSGYISSSYLSKERALVARTSSSDNYNWPSRSTRPTYNHSSGNGYYNCDGRWVPSPGNSRTCSGYNATAVCRDGSYSYSQHRRGTCSGHGGVRYWLND